MKKIVVQFSFFVFLLSSCSYRPVALQIDEKSRENLSGFFGELLLEHGGAYTLYGTKPITVEELIDTSEEAYEEMQKYLTEHPEMDSVTVERQMEGGWKVWKKLAKKPISKNFILTEIKYENYGLLVFVNIKNTLLVIDKYYDLFEKVLGCKFDPNELIEQLRNGGDSAWKKIFYDHTLKGILFGYGYENAVLFTKQINGELIGDGPSENNDPRLPAECYLYGRPFRIPIFSMLDRKKSKQLVQKYKDERDLIRESYKGKDFLDLTLANLQE